jgi:hypothetical protein
MGKWYHLLGEFDLSYVNLHCDLSYAAIRFVNEMLAERYKSRNKDYPIDSIKVREL